MHAGGTQGISLNTRGQDCVMLYTTANNEMKMRGMTYANLQEVGFVYIKKKVKY